MHRAIQAILPIAFLGCSSPQQREPVNVQELVPVAKISPTSFDAEHAAAVAKNPAGVSLTVRTVGGRTRFAEGEKIPIELLFSSSVGDKYELDLATYDRSGRLWSES